MRVLVVGAGAIGGYFGGRMLQAGRDITFLVRPRRASELASAGLVIKSPNGDVTLKNPSAVQADTIKEKFDVVLLSCKAYDLDDAIKSFAPAVGERTSIIPLLNGMKHLDALDRKFGHERVLGGLCAIAVTLNESREVVQLQPLQSLTFGERDGKISDRVRGIADIFKSGNFGATPSEHVIQDMWEKWVFLAAIAASTCLMRAPVGMILAAPGGKDFLLGILDECKAVANGGGFSASRARAGAHRRHADDRRLAADCLDVPRYSGGAARGSRSCDRRPHLARRFRKGAGAAPSHRIHAPEDLREAARVVVRLQHSHSIWEPHLRMLESKDH
jgi:2-dehydropantoate 2-reductase